MTRDPIGYEGSEWNLYEYARSRPLSLRDPHGLAVGSRDSLRRCKNDRNDCIDRCSLLFSGEVSNDLLTKCLEGCDSKLADCLKKKWLGPCPPVPSDSPKCDDYPCGEDYKGAELRCSCKCAGDSPWSQHVRCCLHKLRLADVRTDTAHELCYFISDQEAFSGRPTVDSTRVVLHILPVT